METLPIGVPFPEMQVISVSELKARCIDILKNARKNNEPIIVTLRGKPIARVEPVARSRPRTVRLGALRGRMTIMGDIVRSDIEKDFLVQ